jgi:putative NIF3 family GTP cyclohydrolase 1 type 2
MTEGEFLRHICTVFRLKMAKHTPLTGSSIQRVAVCGGAGSFLISRALASGAGAYITSDIKYHEFFDADGKMLLTDIGHYESEQFTIDLLHDLLKEKFPNFAALKTTVNTNPVRYFAG